MDTYLSESGPGCPVGDKDLENEQKQTVTEEKGGDLLAIGK